MHVGPAPKHSIIEFSLNNGKLPRTVTLFSGAGAEPFARTVVRSVAATPQFNTVELSRKRLPSLFRSYNHIEPSNAIFAHFFNFKIASSNDLYLASGKLSSKGLLDFTVFRCDIWLTNNNDEK